MTRNVDLYLKDILQGMHDAEEFVEGLTYEEFTTDKKTFHAVVRAIEVIGEAAKNVPDSVRGKYPAVPWREMAGMPARQFCSRVAGGRIRLWLRPRHEKTAMWHRGEM